MKEQLRKQMKEQLRTLPVAYKKEESAAIARRLYELDEWRKAETIGITISVRDEVDTAPIIEAAWASGKSVAVPKCNPSTKAMEFRYITSYDQVETVYMDLKEPIREKTTVASKEELSLLIVPGLSFTKKGARLGYGGGYYDRYVTAYKHDLVALAYTEQLISYIPMEEKDCFIPIIVTPTKVFHCT